MPKSIVQKKQIISLIFLLCLLALSLKPFVSRIAVCLAHPEIQNTTDMDIFAGAAKNLLATGQLYQRSDDYKKTYAAGAGVYKFPPAYQLSILPFIDMGNFRFLLTQRIIQLLMYLAGSFLLITSFHQLFIAPEKNRYQSYKYIGLSLLVVMWSLGFFESFIGVEPEILVYFLLCLTFYFSINKPFLSGLSLAIATALKIYPVFILPYFIFKLNIKALAGFILGLALITMFSIYYIGISEHIFYLTKVLPILLTEKPIYHIQNMTIESLFMGHNIISTMSGKITTFVKIFTLISLIITALYFKNATTKNKSILFAMLISGVLLYLPNYWPQYQVILIIPMLCLLAYTINSKSRPLYILFIIFGVAMGAEEMWFGELIKMTYAMETPQGLDAIIKFSDEYPSVDPILVYLPLLWILLRIKDLVLLLPLLFFVISGWILLKDKSNRQQPAMSS